MSKVLVKDKQYPNGVCLTAYISPSTKESERNIEDKIEGFAQQQIVDGTQIQGVFENNKLNGVGFTRHTDGQEFMGTYKDGKRQGIGVMHLGDKTFTGTFENGVESGFGEMEMLASNPEIGQIGAFVDPLQLGQPKKPKDVDEIPKVLIRGSVANMKLNGFGEVINQKTGVVMKGSFKDNMLQGYGVLTINGQSYVGNFDGGKKHGEGAEVDKNGYGYVGDYKSGVRDGWGMDSQDAGQFTGEYKNGSKNGLAEIFDDDGCYTGEVKDGKPHGFGVYNGNEYQYTGEYRDGIFHGEGMYQSNKYQYVGGYQDGKFHGAGFKMGGSDYYKGEWDNGKRQGMALYKDLAGKVHMCKFVNDQSKTSEVVGKEELEQKVGHLDMNKYLQSKQSQIDKMKDKIGEQKERLEGIETGVSAAFQKQSKAHQESCKDLVDEYNQLLDQFNKKLGNFSDRAYKDKVQINIWNRTVEIMGPESKIEYKRQADLDKATQAAQEKYYEENKSQGPPPPPPPVEKKPEPPAPKIEIKPEIEKISAPTLAKVPPPPVEKKPEPPAQKIQIKPEIEKIQAPSLSKVPPPPPPAEIKPEPPAPKIEVKPEIEKMQAPALAKVLPPPAEIKPEPPAPKIEVKPEIETKLPTQKLEQQTVAQKPPKAKDVEIQPKDKDVETNQKAMQDPTLTSNKPNDQGHNIPNLDTDPSQGPFGETFKKKIEENIQPLLPSPPPNPEKKSDLQMPPQQIFETDKIDTYETLEQPQNAQPLNSQSQLPQETATKTIPPISKSLELQALQAGDKLVHQLPIDPPTLSIVPEKTISPTLKENPTSTNQPVKDVEKIEMAAIPPPVLEVLKKPDVQTDPNLSLLPPQKSQEPPQPDQQELKHSQPQIAQAHQSKDQKTEEETQSEKHQKETTFESIVPTKVLQEKPDLNPLPPKLEQVAPKSPHVVIQPDQTVGKLLVKNGGEDTQKLNSPTDRKDQVKAVKTSLISEPKSHENISSEKNPRTQDGFDVKTEAQNNARIDLKIAEISEPEEELSVVKPSIKKETKDAKDYSNNDSTDNQPISKTVFNQNLLKLSEKAEAISEIKSKLKPRGLKKTPRRPEVDDNLGSGMIDSKVKKEAVEDGQDLDEEIKALEKQIKLEKLKLMQKELEKLRRQNQQQNDSEVEVPLKKSEKCEKVPRKKLVKKSKKQTKTKSREHEDDQTPVQNLYLEEFEDDPDTLHGSITIRENSRDRPAETTVRHTRVVPGRSKDAKKLKTKEKHSRGHSKSRDCLSSNKIPQSVFSGLRLQQFLPTQYPNCSFTNNFLQSCEKASGIYSPQKSRNSSRSLKVRQTDEYSGKSVDYHFFSTLRQPSKSPERLRSQKNAKSQKIHSTKNCSSALQSITEHYVKHNCQLDQMYDDMKLTVESDRIGDVKANQYNSGTSHSNETSLYSKPR